MSKPNLLAFSSSVGIYRNKRMRDLRRFLSKSDFHKVEFPDMAPMLFQVVMAYAGENQIDGDFHGYSTQDWCEIFGSNHVQVTPAEASTIIKGFHEVGLFKDQKIRSWIKYNRHLGEYESIVKAKRKAAKLMHKKRELEARDSIKTGNVEPSQNDQQSSEKPVRKPVRKSSQTDSPSKQLWLLNQAIESAKSRKAKATLERQKAQMLQGLTGVDLDAPAVTQVHQAEQLGIKPQDWATAVLEMGKACLRDYPEGLSEPMVIALLSADINPKSFPAAVQTRFAKTIERMRNPVPG